MYTLEIGTNWKCTDENHVDPCGPGIVDEMPENPCSDTFGFSCRRFCVVEDTEQRPVDDHSSVTASVLQILLLVCLVACLTESKDMLRKSIIFDKKTPDVFYCPQKKPKGVDKMLVKAKPLKKLCEFEGKPLPPDYKSDCYNDVDETEYACKEKHRIMKRMKKLEHEIEKKETERAYRSRRISPTSNERHV